MKHLRSVQQLRAFCEVYFSAARQTGRTSQLIDSLNDGDRIIFINSDQARYWVKKCKKTEKNIECIGIDPKKTDELFRLNQCKGRTVFDNAWTEMFYTNQISKTANQINRFQKELSCNAD